MSGEPEPRDAERTPVLFLSGAGLPSWIWDDVRAALAESVETAVAPRPRHAQACLADYADAAVAEVTWPAFAVVAHSSGGTVAAELLARHPARVSGILGVSALFPRIGRSFVGTMPFPARLMLGLAVRLVGTRPPAKVIRTGLASAVPDALAGRIIADFHPESAHLYRDATSPRDLPEIRAYVHTADDKELPPAVQSASARELHATWTEELPTGHLPMLEDPTR